MTTENTPNISDKLAELQQRYFDQLPDKISEIESLWQQFLEDKEDSQLQGLYRLAHSLMGSAGTFGAMHLSRAAKELDHYLKLLLDKDKLPSQEETDVVSRIIYRIKEQAHIAINAGNKLQPQPELHDLDTQVHDEHNLVYVVDDDELITERIACELQLAQFEVKAFNSIQAFLSACDEKLPAVIVMDIVFPDESDNGVQAIQRLKDKYSVLPPIVFISVQTNIDTRLAAMRVGADRFFEKPLDYEKLRASIEGLSARNPMEPYRVMVIDDSVVMADYYAAILNQVGIETRVVNYPLTVLDVLKEFQPDLILMDLYMPECNGIELASVIRQDDDYIHTSIVFLSAEKNVDIQMEAIEIGADDFITKPVRPEQLIAKVVARVKRTRWLNHIHTDLKLAMRDNRHQQTALDSHSIVSMADATGKIIFVNDKFVEISGYSRQELLGDNHRIVKSGGHPPEFYDNMWKTITSGRIWSGEIKNRRKDGTFYWVESTIVPFLDQDGLPYKYVSVRTDITPLMKIQEDLFDAKEKAESASRAKTEFLSSMSHELRTPLNAILGFSQVMLMDELDDVQKENLNEIVKAGNHLLSLISEVLDLARIESDRLSVSMEPVFLCDVIDDCKSLVGPLLEEKGIQLELNKPGNKQVIVTADRIRLKQVLINLLSNAIKYNKTGGRVTLDCQLHDDKVRLSVTDTGIGIADSDKHNLFKPFQRMVDHTYGVEGTGIGLVITRRLIELMGGQIGYSSQEGEGSTFWIELFLDKYVTDEDVCNTGIKSTGNTIDSRQPGKYTVLYVEDNPVNMLLVEKLIKKTDRFSLLKAFTPEEGIELAARYKIDLFLLDINLPGMSGFELLRYFHNQPDTRDIKAIALSANAMVEDVKKGQQSGFDDYITKPIMVDEFISKLEAILE